MSHHSKRHILVAPGALKHSLSALDAAYAIERGLKRSNLDMTTDLLPIADGGNGTLDSFLMNGGTRIEVEVCDPLMRPVKATYGLCDSTALIEMALASGLELLKADELAPLRATTYGTGELMRAAMEAGAQRIIVGMGGSATVDGGAGCLQALGVRLLDPAGEELPRGIGGGGLHRVKEIDVSGLDPRWKQVEVILATDVDNPTLGDEGAAAVFGPQKGATRAQVTLLEATLRHFFSLINTTLGVDVRYAPGGGAAGALSAGLMGVLGAKRQSGIDLILDHHGFDTLLDRADLVITSEGRMDDQTIHGKGPLGVAKRSAARGVKTVALVGGLLTGDDVLHDAGLWATLPIVPAPMPLEEAIRRADELVERAALRLGYLLQL